MRSSNLRLAALIIPALALMSGSLSALADDSVPHETFPGIGSEEAYIRAGMLGNKATELGKKGDRAGAIRLGRQANSIYPYSPMGHHNLGNDLEKEGKLDEARAEQKKATELNPNMLDAWSCLGNIYEKQKNFKEAERCYLKCVDIKPHTWLPLGEVGDILRQQGKFEEAKQWLLRAKKCPDFCQANPISKRELEKKLEQCTRKKASD